jgi:exodeoxyribonuclease VII large subunit
MLSLPASPVIFTVSELNRHAKAVLEQTFPLLWVSGEISNLARAPSGHWYFSLKDSQAQVRCAMFRHKYQMLDFKPENGMQVEARVLVTLYEARGEYQLGVESMRRAGLGALFEAYEKLKGQLAAEGLFDEASKRPLPAFPRRIGIVTSPAAAALRDVITTLGRRMPGIPLILYPTPVQGTGAAAQIASAIQSAAARMECDVLIVCRGGGSIEDLWAFNEEIVARAIAACPIPVISGVGHETDISIADFVADRRAPTPTAAAEMAAPNRQELHQRLDALHRRLIRQTWQGLEQQMQKLDYLARRLTHPGQHILVQKQHLVHLRLRLQQAARRSLEQQTWTCQQWQIRLASAAPTPARQIQAITILEQRLKSAMSNTFHRHQTSLNKQETSLQHLNPAAVLQRGYSMVRTRAGKLVQDSRQLAVNDDIAITFARGEAHARVTEKESTP